MRLPGAEPGAAVPTGLAGPITGFVLRSRMVSGWPGHARARLRASTTFASIRQSTTTTSATSTTHGCESCRCFGSSGSRPAVMLALFDGIPQVVHVEEPRAGIQFGVDETDADGRARAQVVLRNATTGERLEPRRTVRVPFRRGAPGVLHMRALASRMTAEASAELGTSLDAAEFAMQMLQFPYPRRVRRSHTDRRAAAEYRRRVQAADRLRRASTTVCRR